jgi:hypothetical protein
MVFILFTTQEIQAQCVGCTNPTGIVTVGSGQSICYSTNTTITGLTVFFDGVVTICPGVILTISGTTQLSGTAQINMSNCSEIDMLGSFTCSSNNAFVYIGDSTCHSKITIHASSALCSSVTNNPEIYFCNPISAPTSGSPGLATIECDLPLPIELIKFNIINGYENQIIIEWATASELNNDFFTIERSCDAINWEKLSDYPGAGNSSTTINYAIIDENPYPKGSYYRLKQTDFNGNYEYSEIKFINTLELKSDIISIYPNPNTGKFTIKKPEWFNEKILVKIYNINYKIIVDKMIPADSNNINVDITNYSKGLYQIHLTLNDKEIIKSIYKN